MIKGIGKQVILINNTESAVFEQAIFILRSDTKIHSKDVVKECEKLMNLHLKTRSSPSNINGWKVGFFILLALIALLTTLLLFK